MSGVLYNVSKVYCADGLGAQGAMSVIADGCVAWGDDGRIDWVGREADLPQSFSGRQRIDGRGGIAIPGLIDCHTHLAFGGWRDDEFEERLGGKSYSELLREGRGILSTMRSTRSASEDELFNKAKHVLSQATQLGITSVEAKSGYGLTLEDELKTLRVYKRLNEGGDVNIFPTFLGAHAVPPEFRERRDEYVALVTEQMIPAAVAKGLARWLDVFIDDDAFSLEEARKIVGVGRDAGLGVRLHVDQLRDGKGARFAAEVGAASADHLDYADDEGIRAMAKANVTAVLLPIATLMLRQPQIEAKRFLQEGVQVAIATDFNPGSAPSQHLPLALWLACVMHRMTPLQALDGVTRVAAASLGESAQRGSLRVGLDADIAVIEAASVREWIYHFREGRCLSTMKRGREVWRRGCAVSS